MKTPLLFSSFLTFAICAGAATLSPEQALQRVFANDTGQARMSSASKPQLTKTYYNAGQPSIYLFSRGENSGFLAVSADDATVPLLGYSDYGTLPVNPDEMPDGMRYWLNSLSEQTALNSGYYYPRKATPAKDAIEPLTKTKWNQNAPYNDDCPSVDGNRCVTGCVATATAQALKYYNYPATGSGTHSYAWSYSSSSGQKTDTLSFNYGNTVFDWDNMTDTYSSVSTDEQKAAVASLMYACGVGVDMSYAPSGSGAMSFAIVRMLVENFKYDQSLQYLMRDYYGLSEWEDIVYNNIKNYGPVIYGGQSNDGGHEFICDGYNDGYFHFNWGWGGMSDGYFLLTALDPQSQGIGGSTSGYNFSQDIVIGLKPEQTSTTPFEQILWDGPFTIVQSTVAKGGTLTFKGSFFSFSSGTLVEPHIGLILTPTSGEPTFIDYNYFTTLGPGRGIYNGTYNVELPSDLADGVYEVRPAFQNETGDIKTILAPINEQGAYTMTVSGDNATFAAIAPAGILADDFSLDSDLYEGTPFKISATLSDTSAEEEFYGTLTAVLYNGSTVIATGENMEVDLQPGESTEWEYVSPLTVVSAIAPQTDADYELYLCRKVGTTYQKIAGPISATLHAQATPTLKATTLTIADNQNIHDMKASATIECTDGYFAGSLSLIIFPANGGSEIASYQSDFVSVTAPASSADNAPRRIGSSTQLEYNFDFTAGEPDTEYIAGIYNSSQVLSDYVRFRTDVVTGSKAIEVDNPVIKTEYYTLTGIYLGNTRPSSGITITKQTHKDGTITTSRVK